MKVLFIEDDADLRETLTMALRHAGLDVLEERLAESALQSIEMYTPDLLLLDIFMPPGEMSGAELLARLREDTRWHSVPVIVLSGLGDRLNPHVMRRLNVHAVLTKTAVTGTEVARKIEEVLLP
jgi:DNA-binding response OmpR family regulator